MSANQTIFMTTDNDLDFSFDAAPSTITYTSFTEAFDSRDKFDAIRKDYIAKYKLIAKVNAQGEPERNSDGHVIYQRRGDTRFLDIVGGVLFDRVIRHEIDSVYVDCYRLGPIGGTPPKNPPLEVTYKGYRTEGDAIRLSAYALTTRLRNQDREWLNSPEGQAHLAKIDLYQEGLCEQQIEERFGNVEQMKEHLLDLRSNVQGLRNLLKNTPVDEEFTAEWHDATQAELTGMESEFFALKAHLTELLPQVKAYRANWSR